MTAPCRTCGRLLTENDRCEIRGALVYHLGCTPTSAGAPRTLWQAFRALLGIAG